MEINAFCVPRVSSRMVSMEMTTAYAPIVQRFKLYPVSQRDTYAKVPNAYYCLEQAVNEAKKIPRFEIPIIEILPGFYDIQRTIVIDRKMRLEGVRQNQERTGNPECTFYSKNKLALEFIDNSTGSTISDIKFKLIDSTSSVSAYSRESASRIEPWRSSIRSWILNLNIHHCDFEIDKNEKFIGLSIEKGSVALHRVTISGGSTAIFVNEDASVKLMDCDLVGCSSTGIMLQKNAAIVADRSHFFGEQYGFSSNGGKGKCKDCRFRSRDSGVYLFSQSTVSFERCSVAGGRVALYCHNSGGESLYTEFHAGFQCTIWGKGPLANHKFYRCNLQLKHSKSINRVDCPNFKYPDDVLNSFEISGWPNAEEEIEMEYDKDQEIFKKERARQIEINLEQPVKKATPVQKNPPRRNPKRNCQGKS